VELPDWGLTVTHGGGAHRFARWAPSTS
jgi:hypothetical protein